MPAEAIQIKGGEQDHSEDWKKAGDHGKEEQGYSYLRNSDDPEPVSYLMPVKRSGQKACIREVAKRWTVIGRRVTGECSRFQLLADRWRRETKLHSSLSEICFHPDYQEILAMGKDALPFIMNDLEKRSGHWFYALRLIAGGDFAEGAIGLEDARQRWLAWGRSEGYLR